MDPAVAAVHMATAQLCPALLLYLHLLPTHGGKDQGVEAHSSLGLGCVDLLPEGFNVILSRNVKKTICGSSGRSIKDDKNIKETGSRGDTPQNNIGYI